MAHTILHENLNNGLWPKLAATATKFKNIMVNPHKEKCVHEKFFGKMPDYANYLRTLGGMRVVRSIYTVKERLENR